jgi:hypothetical protein
MGVLTLLSQKKCDLWSNVIYRNISWRKPYLSLVVNHEAFVDRLGFVNVPFPYRLG